MSDNLRDEIVAFVPIAEYTRVAIQACDGFLCYLEMRRERDAATAKYDALVAGVRGLVSDWNANGNSRELGDPRAATWHKAADQLRATLDGPDAASGEAGA